MTEIYKLTTEREINPVVSKTSGIRFGWKLRSDAENVKQVSYRIIIKNRFKTVYDCLQHGDETVDITPDITYEPGEEYVVTIISDTTDGICEASGKFAVSHSMHGRFIRAKEHREGAAVYFRHDFECSGTVKRAVAYVAGLGYGTLYLNGQRVDEIYYDAPFSNYEKTVFYRAYDITSALTEQNCIGVHCGEGFYSQSRVWENQTFKYGDICCYAQVNIEYEDGSTSEFYTEPDTWQTLYSPTVLTNVYAGEIHDARLEKPDWCKFGFTDPSLDKAVADDTKKGELKSAVMPPCRVIKRIKPVSVTQIQDKFSGTWVFDMGVNFAGTVTVRFPKSAPGSTYVLRFAEDIDKEGRLDHRTIGVYYTHCLQQHIYIASGKDNERWTPEFCWFSYRYVEITGLYGNEPSVDMLEGIAVSTDFETVGRFETSDEDINGLFDITMRTIRSNYHGFPEDCPGREKCGWLGDAQVVCDAAIYNFDVVSSYEKYMSDIRESRDVYNGWQMTSPGKRGCGFATPLWGCAQIVIPYKLYLYSNDKSVLSDNFEYMCGWIDNEYGRSSDLIINEGLGDWFPPVSNDDKRRITVSHSSTFMFYEETEMMVHICRALRKDSGKYEVLAEKIKDSINRHFYDKKNHTYGYYASNAAAWLLRICPEDDRDALVKSTHELIKDCNYDMTTGIYGNKMLIPMLFESGLGNDAVKILFGRTFCDFGTMMDEGATSLWECLEMHRDPELADRSCNHPMHGGFTYSFYAQLAGIKPVKPGFKTFEISPCTIGAPDRVYAEYDSAYGKIISDRMGGKLTVTVPANTECTVKFGDTEITVGSGIYVFDFK